MDGPREDYEADYEKAMTRKEQIDKAAKEKVVNSVDSGMDEETAWFYGFVNGANWADIYPENESQLAATQAKLDIFKGLIEETVGMWLKHGSFYSVEDHEAWLDKANKAIATGQAPVVSEGSEK